MSCVVVKVRDLLALDRVELLLSVGHSKPYRHPNASYNHIVDLLVDRIGDSSYNAVQWFVTNTARAIRNGFTGFTLKLDKGYWTGNKAGISGRQVSKVIDYLVSNDYITLYHGNKDYRSSWYSNPSVCVFSTKLIEMFDVNEIKMNVPKGMLDNLIVVKDRESKKEIDIEITKDIVEMENEVRRYNDSLIDHLIEYNGKPLPLIEYKRSFSGNIFNGGRLFANGGSIQLLPQEVRLEHLKIDGEDLVECDYHAIHPKICYQLLEPELQELVGNDFDPYDADSSFLKIDEASIEAFKYKHGKNKYNPVRNLYKRALLMAINCASFEQTCSAVAHELYKDKRMDEKDQSFYGIFAPDSSKVVTSLAEHNYLIENSFYKDKGVVLQNIDSRIALRVIDIMIQNGEAALCYHDSFAVRKSAEGLLKAAMLQAWKDILGSNNFCKVEKK